MKQARHNYNTATATSTTAIPTLAAVRSAENTIREKSIPNPPSEETVARLNAIAREYPFCAYVRQHNLYLL
jgi:hypothetical protein